MKKDPTKKIQIDYNTSRRKVFVDMDGVIANFEEGVKSAGVTNEQFKLTIGNYRRLQPYPAGLAGVRELIRLGFDVWIATKIPTKAPWAATEKLCWINEHLPELERSVIITPNKGTLGSSKDFLIDDRPHKAHCEEFAGNFLRFGPHNEFKDWAQVLSHFDYLSSAGNVYADMEIDGRMMSICQDDDGELYAQAELMTAYMLNHPHADGKVIDSNYPFSVIQQILKQNLTTTQKGNKL